MPSVREIKELVEFINNSDRNDVFKTINEEIRFCIEELHGALRPSEKQRVIKPTEDKS